jgi:hypothetical protein
MATVEELLDLLRRVEAATGRNDILNVDIANAFGLGLSDQERWEFKRYGILPSQVMVTHSIDAAAALADLVWPSCDWQFCKGGEGTLIYGGGHYEPLTASGKAKTVPLAICSAILKARICELGGGGAEENIPEFSDECVSR